ncbi:hypothetical protein IMSHALPRED_004076 [Imshaugia aleurites]|uniref:Small secreted protein n=1 Tax=Imshaugia aleurites TaxID=172621 RepID=A0A8H3ENI0_9LECA|nr:hypothetical protein IMSHALPRED_004076 [Imshaugia aleurites]
MLLKPLLAILSSPLFVAASSGQNNANSTITSFNLTAISAVNGASILQCWQITLPLGVSSTLGIQGAAVQQLGNVSSMTWGSLPGGYPGVPHPAPTVLYNVFLSGTLRITIPNSTQEVTVHGGKNAFILAADVANVSQTGHVSSVISDEELTGLMIPTLNAQIPPHKVIHEGACEKDDLQL